MPRLFTNPSAARDAPTKHEPLGRSAQARRLQRKASAVAANRRACSNLVVSLAEVPFRRGGSNETALSRESFTRSEDLGRGVVRSRVRPGRRCTGRGAIAPGRLQFGARSPLQMFPQRGSTRTGKTAGDCTPVMTLRHLGSRVGIPMSSAWYLSDIAEAKGR